MEEGGGRVCKCGVCVCCKEERGTKVCTVKHKGLIQSCTKGKILQVFLFSHEKPLQGMPEALGARRQKCKFLPVGLSSNVEPKNEQRHNIHTTGCPRRSAYQFSDALLWFSLLNFHVRLLQTHSRVTPTLTLPERGNTSFLG